VARELVVGGGVGRLDARAVHTKPICILKKWMGQVEKLDRENGDVQRKSWSQAGRAKEFHPAEGGNTVIIGEPRSLRAVQEWGDQPTSTTVLRDSRLEIMDFRTTPRGGKEGSARRRTIGREGGTEEWLRSGGGAGENPMIGVGTNGSRRRIRGG